MYILLAWLHCSGGFYITTRSIDHRYLMNWTTFELTLTGTEPFTLCLISDHQENRKKKKENYMIHDSPF